MTVFEKHEVIASYEHVIHHQERYVETDFLGKMTVDLVLAYLNNVWKNNPNIAGFSELIDLRGVSSVDMHTGELASLVESGRALDDSSQRSKIALVVEDTFSFFKTELYVHLQQMYPASNKEVEIFKDKHVARSWLLGMQVDFGQSGM